MYLIYLSKVDLDLKNTLNFHWNPFKLYSENYSDFYKFLLKEIR